VRGSPNRGGGGKWLQAISQAQGGDPINERDLALLHIAFRKLDAHRKRMFAEGRWDGPLVGAHHTIKDLCRDLSRCPWEHLTQNQRAMALRLSGLPSLPPARTVATPPLPLRPPHRMRELKEK